MLTIKQITDDKEAVIRGLEKKHFAGAREAIERVLDYDNKRKEAQGELDALNNQVKTLSKSIGGLMKEGKKEEAEAAKKQVADIKVKSEELKEVMKQADEDKRQVLYTIPNIPYDIVPEGNGAEDNLVVKRVVTTPFSPRTRSPIGNWPRSTTSLTSTSV